MINVHLNRKSPNWHCLTQNPPSPHSPCPSLPLRACHGRVCRSRIGFELALEAFAGQQSSVVGYQVLDNELPVAILQLNVLKLQLLQGVCVYQFVGKLCTCIREKFQCRPCSTDFEALQTEKNHMGSRPGSTRLVILIKDSRFGIRSDSTQLESTFSVESGSRLDS